MSTGTPGASSLSPPGRRAVTLLEVLVAVVLFVALLVPVLSLSISANRIGFAANRLLDVTLYGQAVLDGLQTVSPDELLDYLGRSSLEKGRHVFFEKQHHPSSAANPSPVILEGPEGDTNLEAILNVIKNARFPFPVRQVVTLEAMDGDHLGVSLQLTYPRMPTEPSSLYTLVLSGTLTRPSP